MLIKRPNGASESVPGIVESKRERVDWTRRTGPSCAADRHATSPVLVSAEAGFFQSDATVAIAAHALHAAPEAGPRRTLGLEVHGRQFAAFLLHFVADLLALIEAV
jgi:hypothetical protein